MVNLKVYNSLEQFCNIQIFISHVNVIKGMLRIQVGISIFNFLENIFMFLMK